MLTKLASMSVKLKQSFLNQEESRQKKLKLNGKSLYATVSVKYLGTNVDENLNWHQQINNVAGKLNRANAILSKLRHFVNKKTFIMHLFYSCLAWAQNTNSIKRFIFYRRTLCGECPF